MAEDPKPDSPEPSSPGSEAAPTPPSSATPPPAPKPAPAAAAKPAAPPKPPPPPAVMQTTPWESDLTAALKEEFGDSITEFCSYLGQNFLVAKAGTAIPI